MAVKRYDGSQWVTVAGKGNTGADGTAPLTTKGDLLTFGTSATRLAVGNNGETLVADSSASTGLRWQGDYAAAKNKIINGDCLINQRNFSSQTLTTETSVFLVDRIFGANIIGGSSAFSVQQFTLGSAPVSGYEAKQFLRVTTSGQSSTLAGTFFSQGIESVRTFAGQTITVSFWAKASSGTPNIGVEVRQFFGSGGSPSSAVEQASKVAITTGWVRYSKTFTLASISGKTLGTSGNDSLQINLWVSAGTDFNSRTDSLGIQSNTFDIWGMQVEAGSVATAFQTATGTLAGELAACQRYYQRWQSNATNLYANVGGGFTTSTSAGKVFVPYFVPMRATPTSIDYANLRFYDSSAANAVTSLTIDTDMTSSFQGVLSEGNSAATLTANRPAFLQANNSSNGYLGLSAEL